MSPVADFPIVNRFVIPNALGWEYIDRREMPGDEANEATQLWLEYAEGRLDELPGGLTICGDALDDRHERKLMAWDEASRNDKSLTFEDWIAAGRDREYETDVYRPLPQVFLGIKDGRGKIIGGMPWSNIQIESETREKIVVSVFFVPTNQPTGRNAPPRAEFNATRVKWMLTHELPLGDGRVLDIVQWDYTLPKALEAAFRLHPTIIEDAFKLGDEFERRGGQEAGEDGRKIRFRRRDAPPEPAERVPAIITRA